MSAYDALILGLSPLGYWPLDESSGTTAYDTSGNGQDGTYTSGPTLGVTGIGDGSTGVSFDGSNDRVIIPSWPYPGSNDLTVSLWLKVASFSNDNGMAISFGSTVYDHSFAIVPNSSGKYGATSGLALGMSSGQFFNIEDWQHSGATHTRPSTGTWHHYLYRMEEAGAGGNHDLFVDCESGGQIAAFFGQGARTKDLYFMFNGEDSVYLAGSLAKVAVWDRALSDAELDTICTAAQQVAYWGILST